MSKQYYTVALTSSGKPIPGKYVPIRIDLVPGCTDTCYWAESAEEAAGMAAGKIAAVTDHGDVMPTLSEARKMIAAHAVSPGLRAAIEGGGGQITLRELGQIAAEIRASGDVQSRRECYRDPNRGPWGDWESPRREALIAFVCAVYDSRSVRAFFTADRNYPEGVIMNCWFALESTNGPSCTELGDKWIAALDKEGK